MQDKTKDARAESVLRAAAEEFAHRGYAATTYSTIAQRVGMHRNALQYYAPSKPELAVAIIERPFENGTFGSALAVPPHGVAGTIEALTQVAERYLTDTFAHASVRLMMEREIIPLEIREPFRHWRVQMKVLLHQGVDDGELDASLDLEDLSFRLIGAVNGIIRLCESLNELDQLPGRVERTVTEMLRAHRP